MNTENNTQVVDQQYVQNIRGAAKKRKAAILPQYDMNDVRSQHLEKQRLEIMAWIAANPRDEERVNALNSEAWQVVWQRVKYFTYGGSAYQSTNKKGESKQISVQKYNSLTDKQKAKYEKIARDGSGQVVEAQRLIEMHQAAMVALIAGHKTLNGKVLEPGIKAASSACASELRRSLQMPLFEDVEQAEKFHEKAWKLLRAELQHSCDQEVTEYYNRNEMAEKLRACKNRLHLAYPQRFKDKRTFNAWSAKSKLLRETAVNICNGMFCAHDNNSSERKALDKLAEIMHNTLIPSDLQSNEQGASKKRKALKTIKLWRSSGARWIEYTQPDSAQVVEKKQLVELPTGFRHLAHLRK